MKKLTYLLAVIFILTSCNVEGEDDISKEKRNGAENLLYEYKTQDKVGEGFEERSNDVENIDDGMQSDQISQDMDIVVPDVNTDEVKEIELPKNQYLIIFKNEINEELIKSLKGEIINRIDSISMVTAKMSQDGIEKLKIHPDIVSIEEDQVVKVKEEVTDWGIGQVNALMPWNSNYSGRGVKIAILDTGIDFKHEDLVVRDGVSFVDYTNSYMDDNGHGTHVAGIISAQHNSLGIRGVAPKSDIYAVKVLDSNGHGYLSDLIMGLNWALNNDMDIINLSIGIQDESSVLERMVQTGYDDGVIIVAASGNDGSSNETQDNVDIPARYPGTIAVAAVNENNVRPNFSSTGNAVEIAAPGVKILSTYLNNKYAVMDGTSMASAYATATIALMKEAYPNLKANEIRTILQNEAVDLGPNGRDNVYGYGLIQAPAKYFTVITENAPVYDNRTGKLIEVGRLEKGQVYPRIQDYGNWNKIQFGDIYGYIHKSNVEFASGSALLNESSNRNIERNLTAAMDMPVYDNSSGQLIKFAEIKSNTTYPITSDYGNWLRIIVANRVGYIHKSGLQIEFFNSDRYFEVKEDTPIYDNRTGKLVQVGLLTKGQVFPRISDYGNWHRIQFGNIYGYVHENATIPVNNPKIKNENNRFKNSDQQFITKVDSPVFDNSTGKLVQFAVIEKGKNYPIVSDYGNWYRVLISDRVGYIHKSNVTLDMNTVSFSDYFEVTTNELPVYDNSTGSLVQIGTLTKGEVYKRISDYGNWHRIQFGKGYGYIHKSGTKPESSNTITGLNENYKNSNRIFTTTQNLPVYDNSTGRLIQFATILENNQYPVVSDYGNWYRILVSGRVGYVHKSGLKTNS
ncbi:S8 family peptidase [Salirhabdus sp. Marseille-P4669]|uniref:S8 family peptidase n=1 Tax=Salirhabdus sp. Marseille-P4669 TaxID=2042310 RepID=UPI001359C44A|nr:S8 family peptidase [Salirhabdus sp. Marseille-P4669]